MKTCEHCKEIFPLSHISIHYENCPELTDQCPHCNERIPKIIMGDHILFAHQDRNQNEELNQQMQQQQPQRGYVPGHRPWMFQNNESESPDIFHSFGPRLGPLFQLMSSGNILVNLNIIRNRNEGREFFFRLMTSSTA